jgi:RNA-directed DNA polymerase
VTEESTQAREITTKWIERSVWTEAMLTALENGVKGGKWFSLIDKVYNGANLVSAWEQVRRNHGSAGVDRQSIEQFTEHSDEYLKEVSKELQDGTYRPQSIRRVYIPKPGKKEKRPLGIPTVRDRVVQTALRNVIEPIFEKTFMERSYGFRPERSAKDALRKVQELLDAGYTYIVDADIQQYFDTIDHAMLMEMVGYQISDGRILELLDKYLTQSVLDEFTSWSSTQGTPQGAVISPLLANIYLHPLDRALQAEGIEMVRYADDLVLLCKTESEATAALEILRKKIEQLHLQLHPEKTRVVDATQRGGFDFLGYHFERGKRWASTKSVKKLRNALRPLTKRTNGYSLETIIVNLNPILRGWFNYFKHSNKHTFPTIDSWVRMRLRSILRKRNGRHGRGGGFDHYRWPNQYFQERGLFTMAEHHKFLCHSS